MIREAGEAWDYSRSLREQDGWEQHAEFMDALTENGEVVLGGPIGDGRPHRAMQVMEAADEAAVHASLAGDPWKADMLRTASIDRWEILLTGPETRIPRRGG
ncbi:MAG: hypothetical protein WAK93_12410 [Solirubrobacteraceae bacterium]